MASKHHLTEIENQVEKMRETLEDSIQGLSKQNGLEDDETDKIREAIAELSVLPRQLQTLKLNNLRNENMAFDNKRQVAAAKLRITDLEKSGQSAR